MVLKLKIQAAVVIVFLSFFGIVLFQGSSITKAKPNDFGAVENRLPEIADLHHDKIGLGQRITFGLEVIDEEGDFVKIELAEKPDSAKFNQNTLTVDWTPEAGDGKYGKFLIKVTEIPRDKLRSKRTVTKEYKLKIVKEKVKLKELPPTTLEVNALVSIIDPERLKAANKKWDIVSMMQRIGEIEAEKQIKPGNGIEPSNGKQLFKEALQQLAMLHQNPTLDPENPKYDDVWNAENWRLIAVRPRLNKKVFEIRPVYFNVRAAEQVYLMPRMRIIRGDDAKRSEELRQKNNLTFAKKFHETFFDGEHLKDFVENDKAKYGEALADFMTWVLTYRDPSEPMMRANFAALPHNSRLGGGNVYDSDGKYLHGDGWALGALKVNPVMRNGKRVLAINSPPIAGFVSSIKPDTEGTKFKPAPAPVTDKNSPGYKRGWEILYDDVHGTVHVPEIKPDGSVEKAVLDTSINGFDYKFGYMTAETKLQDPRRRLFEEKGMTCIQCHVRNFDEGDYLVSVQKPGKKASEVANRPIPRVFFIITPTLHNGRNEYIHREEQEQVGNLQGVFRDYLGIDVKMSSPLALDWVHGTKKGRS
ncbi:MAG: hypothetical protein HKN33_02500 [Pyrinomonadaceae bacterium]|nr:hypothetical protein [Pyrinomonadaceae bacterium]